MDRNHILLDIDTYNELVIKANKYDEGTAKQEVTVRLEITPKFLEDMYNGRNYSDEFKFMMKDILREEE